MAQISYGTITINDITDISNVYLIYALALSSANATDIRNDEYDFDNLGERGWDDTHAREYPTWQSGYQIWIRQVTIKEGIDEPEYGTPYLDTAVNQINNNYINLNDRIKKIWSNSTGSYMASGINNNDVNENNVSTYGYNSKSTTTGISFNYNAIPLIEMGILDSGNFSGIKLYSPILTNSTISSSRLDATLTSWGLKLVKGGIYAGLYNSTASDENQHFVYLSSEDYGVGTKIGDSASNKTDWRQIIGNKFGVDKAGNLYAAGAHIDGDIVAQSLTIGSGANAYSGIAAINISGYSIEIEVVDIAGSTNTKKLIPHLYHNGMNADSEVTDVTKFLWYIDNNMSVPGAAGLSPDGYIIGEYGHTYKVIYDFGDGVVGSGSAIQTRTVDPQKYITRISDTGITIHPEMLTEQSSWIQLDGNGMELFNSSNESIARYGNTAKIGFDASSRFLINASSLQAYNNNNQLYFEVNANGLTWGNNVAATTEQVETAAQTASKYITAVDQNGIKVHAENGTNINYSLISDEGLEIFQGTSVSDTKSIAKFGSTARIGKETGANTKLSNASIIMFDGQSPILQMSSTGATAQKIDIYKSRESTSTGSSGSFDVDFSDSSVAYVLYIYHNNHIIRSIRVSSSTPTISSSTQSTSVRYDSNTTVSVSTTVGYTKYTESGSYSISISISGVSAENVRVSKMVVLKYYIGEAPYLSFGSRDESKNKGAYSATFGAQLSGQQEDQFVIGKYNDNKTDTVLEIGNGTDNAHSNALTVDWDGNVEAAGNITGINVNASNLIASNSIQVPKGKNIYLDGDNHINKLYCSTGSGTDNIYYKTNGYHAFLTADSTTRFYIQNTQVNSNVPYKAGGVKLFTIGWTAEVDNAQIAANGYADYKITIPSKSNYTPIAVVGYYFANATTNGANSSSISCNMAYYVSSENKARLMCRNHASSVARVRYAAAILYVATIQGI